MSHQFHIGARTSGLANQGGPPTDIYAAGIQKLHELAKDKKLGRFKWPKAGGMHSQAGTGNDSYTQEDCNSGTESGSSG